MIMSEKIKNYQRLTHYNENTRKAVVYDYISMSPEWSPVVNRLAAFEDAIESGEILLKEEAEKLKSENAALHERLEKAVEFPCKVGDNVFCIVGLSPAVEEFEVEEIVIQRTNPTFAIFRFIGIDTGIKTAGFLSEYGKRWFTELEAAEARLAELEGEKE